MFYQSLLLLSTSYFCLSFFLSVRLSVQNVKLTCYGYDYIPCDCGLTFFLLFIYPYLLLFKFSLFVTFSSFYSYYNIFLLLLILPSSLIFPLPLTSFFATYIPLNCLPPPTFPSLMLPHHLYFLYFLLITYILLTTYLLFTTYILLTTYFLFTTYISLTNVSPQNIKFFLPLTST